MRSWRSIRRCTSRRRRRHAVAVAGARIRTLPSVAARRCEMAESASRRGFVSKLRAYSGQRARSPHGAARQRYAGSFVAGRPGQRSVHDRQPEHRVPFRIQRGRSGSRVFPGERAAGASPSTRAPLHSADGRGWCGPHVSPVFVPAERCARFSPISSPHGPPRRRNSMMAQRPDSA